MRKSVVPAAAENPGTPNRMVMSCVALIAKIMFQPRACSTVLAPEARPEITVEGVCAGINILSGIAKVGAY